MNNHDSSKKGSPSHTGGKEGSTTKQGQDDQSRKAPSHQQGDAKRSHESPQEGSRQDSNERGRKQGSKGENE